MARRNTEEPEQRIHCEHGAEQDVKRQISDPLKERKLKEVTNTKGSNQPLFTGKQMMEKAREKFESILAAKGKDVPVWDGRRYENINIQTYWRWFLLGWTMQGDNT